MAFRTTKTFRESTRAFSCGSGILRSTGIGEMEVGRRMATSIEDKEVEVEVAEAVAAKSETRVGGSRS
jgi:hypothetical protein